MEDEKQKRHIDRIIRMSRVFLLAASGLFALSLWVAPFSWTYILALLLIGVIASVLLILYWKTSSTLLYVAYMIVVIAGIYVRKIFFPDDYAWVLALQYIAVVFGVCSCSLILFGKRIKKQLYQ